MEARFAQQANARRALVPNISQKLEIALPNIVYCMHVADLLMSSLPIASLTFSITISSNRAFGTLVLGKVWTWFQLIVRSEDSLAFSHRKQP